MGPEPPVVFCPPCGARIPEGRRTCPGCGAVLERPLPRRGSAGHRLMTRRELPGELKVAAGCSGGLGLFALIVFLVLVPVLYEAWISSGGRMRGLGFATFAAAMAGVTVAVMALLLFGFSGGRPWAWWIAVVFFGLHVLQAAGLTVLGLFQPSNASWISPLLYGGMFGVVFWLVLRARRSYAKYGAAKRGGLG